MQSAVVTPDLKFLSSLHLRDWIAKYTTTGHPVVDLFAGVVAVYFVQSITRFGEKLCVKLKSYLSNFVFNVTGSTHKSYIEYTWYPSATDHEKDNPEFVQISPEYKAIMFKISRIKDKRIKKLRWDFNKKKKTDLDF